MNSLLSHKTRPLRPLEPLRFVNEVGTSKFISYSERNAAASAGRGADPNQDDSHIWLGTRTSGLRVALDRHSAWNDPSSHGHVTNTWDVAAACTPSHARRRQDYARRWETVAAETFSARCALGLLALAGAAGQRPPTTGCAPARRILSTMTKTLAARTRRGPRPRMGPARRQPAAGLPRWRRSTAAAWLSTEGSTSVRPGAGRGGRQQCRLRGAHRARSKTVQGRGPSCGGRRRGWAVVLPRILLLQLYSKAWYISPSCTCFCGLHLSPVSGSNKNLAEEEAKATTPHDELLTPQVIARRSRTIFGLSGRWNSPSRINRNNFAARCLGKASRRHLARRRHPRAAVHAYRRTLPLFPRRRRPMPWNLRELQDWVVEPRLLQVAGVADVTPFRRPDQAVSDRDRPAGARQIQSVDHPDRRGGRANNGNAGGASSTTSSSPW